MQNNDAPRADVQITITFHPPKLLSTENTWIILTTIMYMCVCELENALDIQAPITIITLPLKVALAYAIETCNYQYNKRWWF